MIEIGKRERLSLHVVITSQKVCMFPFDMKSSLLIHFHIRMYHYILVNEFRHNLFYF